MPISVYSLQRYKRQLKRLQKKYRTALAHSVLLSDEIALGQTPGDAIPGYDGIVYKLEETTGQCLAALERAIDSFISIHPPDQATILSVYAKTEQADSSDGEIAALLREADRLLSRD